MKKRPKGLSQKLHEAVRSRVVPLLTERGFSVIPGNGRDGEWQDGAYYTDLYRPDEADVDILQVWVYADRELSVMIDAVRGTSYGGDPTVLPIASQFPINARYRLPGTWSWRRPSLLLFHLGPPWPADSDVAIARLIGDIATRLPILFDYLADGKRRSLLRITYSPRWPITDTIGR